MNKLAPVVLFAALALAGCAATPTSAPTSAAPVASTPAVCTDKQVKIVVDFGTLDQDSVHACGDAGAASAALKDAGLTTEGTADYGDQVVCRVNGEPAPADETCATLPSAAYWALWVKATPTGKWEYAQEGVNTLQVTAGESIGLVYTAGTDSTPPQD